MADWRWYMNMPPTAPADFGAKIKIHSMDLWVPCAILESETAVSLTRRLEREAAIFSFRRNELIQFHMSAGTKQFISDTFFPGKYN